MNNIKGKILNWIKKFPTNAKKWSDATDELPTIHARLAEVWKEFSTEDGYNYLNKKPKYDYDYYMLNTNPKTPGEFNKHHKNGIRILLNILSDEHITEVYDDYSHWLNNINETKLYTSINEFKRYLYKNSLNEKINYIIDNELPILETFRPGSKSFIDILKYVRLNYKNINLNDNDKILFESTDIGYIGIYENKAVLLDVPFEYINEAEYKGKEVELNKPMRGGSKKYYVYVKNPDTDNVIKIEFGDPDSTAKVSDPEARKRFAARHKCDQKKDKTTAGYWACRINRYGHLWNGKTYPGYW